MGSGSSSPRPRFPSGGTSRTSATHPCGPSSVLASGAAHKPPGISAFCVHKSNPRNVTKRGLRRLREAISQRGVSPPRGTSSHEPRLHGGGHRVGPAFRGGPLRLPPDGSHHQHVAPRLLPQRDPCASPLWHRHPRGSASPPTTPGKRFLEPTPRIQ